MSNASLPFKKAVLERLNEVYTFAKGEHDSLSADGYKIAITALLGFTPTDWEADEVFKNQQGLNLEEFKAIVEYKLKFVHPDQYICDFFPCFDKNYKGYININDIRNCWEKVKCKIPWSKVEESFRSLTNHSILDYSEFCKILSSNQNKLHKK